LLDELRRSAKAVRLEIIEGPSSFLASLLAQGKLDLALLFDEATDSGLAMKPAVREQLLFVGPPGTLSTLSNISAVEAATRPLLLLSRPNGIREAVERLFADVGIQPQVLAEINAPRLLIEAVQAGFGYSVIPACGIEDALRAHKLDAVSLEGGRLTRTVFIGTSRLFSLSQAAEYVFNALEKLIYTAVSEGRWHAQVIKGEA
jgi:DNA-binding transcriptional LysR family regulator